MTTTPTKKFSEIWDLFAQSIPAEASRSEREVQRHAFYCGAISLISSFEHIRRTTGSTEDATQAIATLVAEVNRYKANLVMQALDQLVENLVAGLDRR